MPSASEDLEALEEPGSRPSSKKVTIPRKKLRKLVQMLAHSVLILRNDIELVDKPQPGNEADGDGGLEPPEAQSIVKAQPDEVVGASNSVVELEDRDVNVDRSDDSDYHVSKYWQQGIISPDEMAVLRAENLKAFEELRASGGVSKNISLDPWRCLGFVDWEHFDISYTKAGSYPDTKPAKGAAVPFIIRHLLVRIELRATVQRRLLYGFSRWWWNHGRNVSWPASGRGPLDMGPWMALIGMRLPGYYDGDQLEDTISSSSLDPEELVRMKILQVLLDLPSIPARNGVLSAPHKECIFWGTIITVGQILNQCYRLGILDRPSNNDWKAYKRHLQELLKSLEIFNLWHVVKHQPRIQFRDICNAERLETFALSDLWNASCSNPGRTSNPLSEAGSFQCREMSLEMLRKLGNIQIQWTEYMDEHLELDSEDSTLKIFWFGFAAMASPMTYIGREEYNFTWCPCSQPHMGPIFDELSETYSLLFRSRKNRLHEDLTQYGLLPVPQWLRVFYGNERGTLSAEEAPNMSYFLREGKPRVSDIEYHLQHINSKLPPTQLFEKYKIWGDRLRQLKAYMDSQKPGGIRGLWVDKRDSLQWYTFWAVIIVGGASVILSILGLMVSIVQTVGTFKGLE